MENLLDRLKPLPDLDIVYKPQEKSYVVFRPQNFGGEPLKLGEDIGYFLEGIVTGKIYDADYLDNRWDSRTVVSVLDVLRQQQLVAYEEDLRELRVKSEKAISRFHMPSPTSIQFDLFNKPRHFQWLKTIARPAVVKALTALSLFFAVVGIIALIANWNIFYKAASTPLSVFGYISIVITTITVISIHEWSHALALVYCGGMPRRIGFMLFYFSPAFFCDVTDGWRFEEKEKRVAVALAGVISTFGIAGFFTVIFLISGSQSAWMGVVVPMLYVVSLFNLLPFVKFDGYIALMAHINESHLRTHAMNDWKEWITYKLSGTSDRVIPLWRIVYGLACSAFPVILVGAIPFAYLSAQGTFEGFLVSWISVLVSVWFIGRGIWRLGSVARKNGVSLARRGLAFLGAMALILGMLFIPFPHSIKGAYWVEHGQVLATLSDVEGIENETIELRENGFYFARHVGYANWNGEETSISSMPVRVVSPNLLVEGKIDTQMKVIVLEVDNKVSLPEVGTFEAGQRKKSLGKILAENLFQNPFSSSASRR